jgi:FMN hydrolase / 5-amino-6-(5-phospho-D-ribitylamino)uracil phosphatase
MKSGYESCYHPTMNDHHNRGLATVNTKAALPRIISFDLDDTLWPVQPVIRSAEAALMSWLRTHHPRTVHGLTNEALRDARALVAARFPERSHDLTFLRRRALGELFEAAGHADAHGLDSPASQAMEIFLLERNRVEFYADVLPALERLRAHHRLFALSNGNADLRRCGIADFFDGHVTAAQAGAAKPDTRIFAELLRVSGAEPAQVMHVGDDPLADVAGAQRAGLHAVWLNRHGRAWPDELERPPCTISSLAQIM